MTTSILPFPLSIDTLARARLETLGRRSVISSQSGHAVARRIREPVAATLPLGAEKNVSVPLRRGVDVMSSTWMLIDVDVDAAEDIGNEKAQQ